MLKALFASETRVKLLNVFLLNPEKKYNVSKLTKETGSQAASVRKELKNLTDFGLLNTSPEKDKDEWSVNSQFIILPELRALIAKAQILSSQKFIEGLKKISTPYFLALTGFFTGDDLVKTDILIVGKIKRRLFSKLLKDLEKDLGKSINYTIMDKTEFFYRQEVMDIFLYNILTGKTIVLVDKREEEEGITKIKPQSNEDSESDN